MKPETVKVYLDRLCDSDIADKDWIKSKFYSYKNEVIVLNSSDKLHFENLLRDSFDNETVIFIKALSIKNNYHGGQDVVLELEYTDLGEEDEQK